MCRSKAGIAVLVSLFTCAVLYCLPVLSSAEDLSGAWDITVETPQGTANPSVVLKQDGERLTGTYRGRMGESSLEGSVKGNAVQFAVKIKFQDQDFLVTYSGTVDGGTMKGVVQFGDSASGSWTARRRA